LAFFGSLKSFSPRSSAAVATLQPGVVFAGEWVEGRVFDLEATDGEHRFGNQLLRIVENGRPEQLGE